MKIFQKIKFDFIDVIVLSSYYLFVCFLSLGLFGFFNQVTILLVVAVLLLAIVLLRKNIIFSKKYLWFFAIVPAMSLGFALLRGFIGGDAYQLWLASAKDLALTGSFPGFTIVYYFSRMPLFTIFLGATMSLLGFNEVFCLWIPLFFTSAALILIYQWAEQRHLDKKYLIFVPLLLLTNVSVAFYGSWNLLQESLVLFFATALFYYYEKYLSDGSKKYLILLILSFVLACASKISGFFLFFVILYLFFKDKNKKEIFSYLLFFSVPIILWLARNYLVFSNPIYPILNNLFKGRYDFVNQKYYQYHPVPVYLNGLWHKYIWVFKEYLWAAFPFIVLSIYALIKEKRYDYLLTFGLYLLVKEIFLFTPTDASARYYYLFLGLFIIYALVGLQKLKSKSFITFLMAMALAGLLFVPVTNSASAFISIFESKLIVFSYLFNFLSKYWYIVVLAFIPLIYKASDKEEIKIFLLFFYCLYILHLRFVANKSWINTWPIILIALMLLLVFVLLKKFNFSRLIIAIIIATVLLNSWLMGAVYYLHQGEFSFPVKYMWEGSQWAHEILDAEIPIEQRDDFYVLVHAQPGYFFWRSDYKTPALFTRHFWQIVSDYNKELTSAELQKMLKEKKIKYVVKNEIVAGFYPEEYEIFFTKIKDSKYFKVIAKQNSQYFIWQVY